MKKVIVTGKTHDYLLKQLKDRGYEVVHHPR